MVATIGQNWKLAPSLIRLMIETDDLYPNRSTASDGSIGDAGHATRVSDHNPSTPRPPGWVDAVDLTDDDNDGCDVQLLINHLVRTRDKRVKYLIHRGSIWKSYPNRGLPAWVRQPYTGPNAHMLHLHISILESGRFSLSSWWPTIITPAPRPPVPTPTPSENDMAAPPFTLHLDSRNGKVWKVGSDEQSKTWITGPTQQAATNSLTISQTRLTAFGFGAGSTADYSVIAPASTTAWHNWLDNIKTVT